MCTNDLFRCSCSQNFALLPIEMAHLRRKRPSAMILTSFLFLTLSCRSESRRFHSRTFAFAPARQWTRSEGPTESSLRLSLNLNGEKKPDKNKKDEEDDFPAWVQGLSRWPLYPASSREEDVFMLSEERNRTGLAISGAKLPLANLINVEALLMSMNEKDTINDSKGLELFVTRDDRNQSAVNATVQQGGRLSILPDLEELANWEKLANNLRRSMADAGYAGSSSIGGTTDAIIKEATARIEYLVALSSKAISPSAVQDLFQRAGRALSSQDGADLVKVATRLAREQGLNVTEASERTRQTTEYTMSLVKLANGVLQNGFAAGDKTKKTVDDDQKALFSDFKTAKTVSSLQYRTTVAKAAELGSLSGAIYEETIPRTLGLGHSFVANGTSEDVTWMVTDCIANEDEYLETGDSKPVLVRTITVRGYDASDENVDRELLLNRICTATPEKLKNGVSVHGGLLSLARSVYKDVKPFIDLTAPDHRLVLTGHSVGGSLSVLLLLLMVEDEGVQFVRDKVLRVYTFGSPPVASTPHDFFDGEAEVYLRSIDGLRESDPEMEQYKCDTLKAFGLSCSMVYGFVQPWDPLVRLFTEIDPLYPLVGDIGEDGFTAYASGPPRTLRPITRAIFESWDGWPLFRDTFRATSDQNYTSVGVQHILLPEPIRYLSDRFVAANVNIPPVESILRISSKELLPGLDKNFPLDVFRISFVPAAIRGFVHHFYPAYGFPIVDFASKKMKEPAGQQLNDREKEDYRKVLNKVEEKTLSELTGTEKPSREKDGRMSEQKAGRWF